MSEPFRVSATVDFETDGKQFGALNVPYSSNESAWGAVRVPIVVINGGAGPTLLCTGGVHGDEYEGPIALGKLARGLEAAELAGRLILLPALNLPAVLAGARVSPIDGINLNRAFPGKWDGTVTEMIADFVTRRILPSCDAVLDLHAGGRTLQFLPFCGMHVLEDAAQMARTHAAMLAFGAPFSVIIDEFDRLGMLDTAVEQLGKVFLFTELGGGGAATAATVAIAERGIGNVLRHFGMIDTAVEQLGKVFLFTELGGGGAATSATVAIAGRGIRNLLRHFEMIDGAPEPAATRLLRSPDPSYFVVSEDRGLFEILLDPGAEVEAGQPIARIHDVESPARAPITYRAERAGLLIGRRWPGSTRPGDCLAVIATDAPER